MSDWNTFDPSGQLIPTGPSQEIVLAAYDRLLGTNAKGDLIPYLAKSWRTPDASTAIFDLRSDVKCADGTPLTPTAIANSFSRLFKSPNAPPVFGSGVPTIEASDSAHTIQFKWPSPNADAIFGFASTYASVICPSGLGNVGKLTDTPSGSGPYVLSTATHGVSATMMKNPAWQWGPTGLVAKDLADTMTFNVVTSDTTAANELVTGQLDVASIQGPDVDRLIADRSLTHLVSASYKLSPLVMNATAGHPTSDPQVRRAIMTAIDPAAWNQAANGGRGVTGTSIFSKQALCYDPATAKLMPQPSMSGAKQILTSDGYVAGANGQLTKDGKVLSLTVAGSPAQFGKGTEYIGSQLTSLGANVTLADVDRATYVTRYLRAGNADVTVFPIGSQNIPSSQIQYIAGPLPPKGTNFSYYVDPTVDADLDSALSASPTGRCQAWAKFQEDVLRNYDMMPLAASTIDLFTQPKLSVILVAGGGLFDPATLTRTA